MPTPYSFGRNRSRRTRRDNGIRPGDRDLDGHLIVVILPTGSRLFGVLRSLERVDQIVSTGRNPELQVPIAEANRRARAASSQFVLGSQVVVSPLLAKPGNVQRTYQHSHPCYPHTSG